MPQTSTSITDLVARLRQGEVVLFIGAGLSIGAGLPGWGALIRPLAQSVGYRLPAEDEFLTADHLLTAAQHYENQRSRASLLQHLRDELDTTGVRPTPAHSLIVSLRAQVIFTTNYDDLIELALRQAGRRFSAIVSESQLAFWSEDRVQVVKLCGDLQRPDSVIISKNDFNTYLPTHPRLAERLRTTLESKTALFLGYSLQDPFFNQIWDHIGLDFGKLRRAGYAVLFDVNPLDADDLRQRGIHVVSLQTQGRDRTALLAEWLQALAAELESSAEPEARPAAEGQPEPAPPTPEKEDISPHGESSKDEQKAKLQGIELALAELEIEREKGMIDFGRYLQLKQELETRKAKLK
jgi:hypothetical protein